MKKLYILISFFSPLLISSCCKSQQVKINDSGVKLPINNGNSGIRLNPWVDSAILDDDGYYNGFPMMADANGLNGVGVIKKASGHAPSGPLTLVKTNNGGISWTKTNIKVDGVQISSTNHSFAKTITGRLLISYRVSGVCYFAYNDNWDENFTSSATIINPESGDFIANSPIKMIQMPSGKIQCYFYTGPLSGLDTTKGVIYESSNNGTTYTFKSNVFVHNSAVSNPTIGDWRGNEIGVAITHNTGNDATCKMIALVRIALVDIAGTFPMFFYSSDGGTTWTKDLVNHDPGSYVDDNGVTINGGNPGFSRHVLYAFIGTNSPFDIREHNGLIYVINGERNRTGGAKYALKYITATPDNAYRNKWSDWIRPIQVGPYYNAATIGASVDCGYANVFKADGHLYVAQYDVSTQAADPFKSETRVFSEIVKIAN